jgi:hypothetical protein
VQALTSSKARYTLLPRVWVELLATEILSDLVALAVSNSSFKPKPPSLANFARPSQMLKMSAGVLAPLPKQLPVLFPPPQPVLLAH